MPKKTPDKPIPQIGWMLHYVAGRELVRAVTTRRAFTGAQGTEPLPGQVYAALVVGHVSPAEPGGEILLNLKVQLDGEDIHWAQHVAEGQITDDQARDVWRWPTPVDGLPI